MVVRIIKAGIAAIAHLTMKITMDQKGILISVTTIRVGSFVSIISTYLLTSRMDAKWKPAVKVAYDQSNFLEKVHSTSLIRNIDDAYPVIGFRRLERPAIPCYK
jgi:uncharacterized membrane protein